ncbi:MAG: hypothetical protein ABIP48_06695 [Planctomycetota bacterium]
MGTNQSTEAFLGLVQERLDDLRGRLDELVQLLPQEDRDQKVTTARAALEAANVLNVALAREDQPSWLAAIREALSRYCHTPGANHAVLVMNALTRHYVAIKEHSFDFGTSGVEPFDFDGVYERYRSESRVPELFDKLIEILEKIVQCKELDSRSVVEALETIIATLRKNREGSFFSMVCSWDFFRTYMKNVAWEQFESIPVLGPFVTALHTTIGEMDKEMSNVYQGMNKDLIGRVSAEFPALTYQPLALPAPPDEPSEESDDDADSIQGETES